MNDEEIEKKEKKEIEVITGDGKDLNISDVYDYIKTDNPPTDEKKKNVVIPKEISNKNDKKR